MCLLESKEGKFAHVNAMKAYGGGGGMWGEWRSALLSEIAQ
jgi:hypothetical protein